MSIYATSSGCCRYHVSYFRYIRLSLMQACGFTTERPKKEKQHRANDPISNLKSVITPHYFRHNYVTMLYESGIDPLIAMKIVGHTDYQTTANIWFFTES